MWYIIINMSDTLRDIISKCQRPGWVFGMNDRDYLKVLCTESDDALKSKYKCPPIKTYQDAYNCAPSRSGTSMFRFFKSAPKKKNIRDLTCKNYSEYMTGGKNSGLYNDVYKYCESPNACFTIRRTKNKVAKCNPILKTYVLPSTHFSSVCDGHCVEVNDYVEGNTLRELGLNKYGDLKTWEYIFKKLIDAVNILKHETGKNHGDLHVGNIIYNTKTDKLMLIDPDFNKSLDQDYLSLLSSILRQYNTNDTFKIMFNALINVAPNPAIASINSNLRDHLGIVSNSKDGLKANVLKHRNSIVAAAYENYKGKANDYLELTCGTYKDKLKSIKPNASGAHAKIYFKDSIAARVANEPCLNIPFTTTMPKTYFKYSCPDSTCLSVMNRVPGKTLYMLSVEEDKNYETTWKEILNKLWDAVEKFHKDTGRAHGDLNYNNIIVTTTPNINVKLIDSIGNFSPNINYTVAQDILKTHMYMNLHKKTKPPSKNKNNNIGTFNRTFFEKLKEKDPGLLRKYYDSILSHVTLTASQRNNINKANKESNEKHSVSEYVIRSNKITITKLKSCLGNPLKCLGL